MNVRDLIPRELITVTPENSVAVAVRLLRRRGIRQFLVLKNGPLVLTLLSRPAET